MSDENQTPEEVLGAVTDENGKTWYPLGSDPFFEWKGPVVEGDRQNRGG